MTSSVSGEFDDALVLLRDENVKSRDAVAAAFEQHRAGLLRFVRTRLDPRLQGRYDPSDVVQEALLVAWKRLAAYLRNPSVPLFLWLRLLTSQKVIEIHRREFSVKRGSGRECTFASMSSSASCSAGPLVTRSIEGPGDSLAREETRARVETALARIGPVHREVIRLRYFQGLSNTQVARALGIRPAAAAQRHSRALKRLEQSLRDAARHGVESLAIERHRRKSRSG